MNGDGASRLPRVAFQGEAGAFSEQAALASVDGGPVRPLPCPTLEELFALTGAGGADFAVAPIENTLYGSIHRTYELLAESPLHVVGERIVHVRHHLIGCQGASLADVRTVESHPAALGQCERFFAAHAALQPREADDTAASVRRVCHAGDPARAAIGSERAARLHRGQVLARDIQDHPRNFTRFFVLARQRATAGMRDKLAVTVQLAHRPGTLLRALEPFAARGIDLTRIESRPIAGEPWRYRFFLDLAGADDDPAVRAALDELRAASLSFRVLGCFRAASHPELPTSSPAPQTRRPHAC